jgi:cell division protease FtsH
MNLISKVIILFTLVSNVHTFLFSNPNRASTIYQLNSVSKYPHSQYMYEQQLKRLNSKNNTIRNQAILNSENDDNELNITNARQPGGVRIIINKARFDDLGLGIRVSDEEDDIDKELKELFENFNSNENNFERYKVNAYGNNNFNNGYGNSNRKRKISNKSDNFEVIAKSPYNFTHVGGYDNIKLELDQVVDILSNHTKYSAFNVRIPKGLIFEGPPGNGKTLFAKALAGEANISFIAVSGSEFAEKYVGVGASKVRELFKLATDNVPCIIFIDEIDAIGRKRSDSGETSNVERDGTLNELLVGLDGFKPSTGVFLVGATNRVDLLDTALTRPGRIDKRIFITNPDEKTRLAVINIHIQGKPCDHSVKIHELVELTAGLSGAQIENLLNEAMLNALRYNRFSISSNDIDKVLNKIMVGWQPNEHQFNNNIIDHIAIHELGHAVVGLLSKHHSKMTKVIINLSAPTTPAYTVFESHTSNIMTREALFEHLMILLSGRIAEEVIYERSVTTGALSDFEEALKLAERMILYYGMGKEVIYPSNSEKYKEIIDNEVFTLINDAYDYSEFIIRNSIDLIREGSEILKSERLLTAETLLELMHSKYQNVLDLKINR